jgi:hypothetical protein
MKIKRTELLKCLQLVESGLSTGKETVAQASCFVFKDGYLMTFNDEIFCRIPCRVGFTGAVTAKTFLGTLARFKDDEISFTQNDTEVVASVAGRRAGFRLEAELLLPVGDIQSPEEDDWVAADAGLSSAFGNVANCTGTDEEKFHRTCVNVTPTYVEACDNYHLMRAAIATQLTKDESFLVRGASIKPIDGLKIEQVATTSDWLCFLCDDGLEYYCRRYLDDYPDLSEYFEPFDGDKFVPPAGFAEAVETGEVFTSENEIQLIKVDLKEGAMMLSAEGATGWFQQRFKVSYKGKALSFHAPPKLMRLFATNYTEGVLSDRVLRVETDEFVYLTSLGSV